MSRPFTLHGFRASDDLVHKQDYVAVEALVESLATRGGGILSPDKIKKLADKMKDRDNEVGGVANNINAGYTYFGQFLAHDISYFKHLEIDCPPLLNLHVLYGMGPDKSGHLFNMSPVPQNYDSFPFVGVKFDLWKGKDFNDTVLYDFSRLKNGMPIIGDTRNDENFIISQLHLLFLRFHNKCADEVYKRYKAQGIKNAQLFAKTRQLVIWHYQLILLTDYLPQLLERSLLEALLQSQENFKLFKVRKKKTRLSPLFSEAAFRMGHSQVRNSYTLTGHPEHTRVPLFSIHEPDKLDLTGFKRDRRRNIDWNFFFQLGKGTPQVSLKIDHIIAQQLHSLPFANAHSQNLVETNIHRSNYLSLARNELRGKLKADIEKAGESTIYSKLASVFSGVLPNVRNSIDDFNKLPLWLYILAEAQAFNEGKTLGPVGSRIIAEQIVWILRRSPGSIFTEKIYKKHTYSMSKLIRFLESDSESDTDSFLCKDLINLT